MNAAKHSILQLFVLFFLGMGATVGRKAILHLSGHQEA